MLEDENKINLTDIIDIELLQELQDTFATTMGVASIAVDANGPITKPSNFTDFCIEHTRGSAEGYKRCNACDIKWGEVAAKSGKPVIYNCHTGLKDFAVPIVIEGQHIASILGGQILTKKPDEEYFRKIAKELDIDEDKYVEALRKIKIIPEEKVNAAANFLYLVANTISKVGHKNLELIKKNNREKLYRRITRIIRSTLDIDETKQKIVETIGKTLGADRCFITEFDKLSDKFFIVHDEYLSSENIKGYKGADVNEEVPHFAEALKRGKTMLINKGDIFINKEKQNFDIEKEAIKRNGVVSAFAFPLYYNKEFLGVLSTHYVTKEHEITNEEISLIANVSNQVSVAIYQAKLYNTLKQTTANQNAILNNIPFMAWLKDTQSRLLAVNEPFSKMCNIPVENIIGKTDFDFFPKDYAESYVKEDKIAMETKQTLASNDIITGPDGPKWHETFKSPVLDDKGNAVGTVGLSRDITERMETELELLRRQKQITLAMEKEIILRDIIKKIRSSLNIEEIKHEIATQIGSFLRADRVAIAYYDYNLNNYTITENGEYRSSNNVKTFVGVDFTGNPGFAEHIRDTHFKGKDIIFNDLEEYLDENDFRNTDVETFYRDFGFSSSAAINMYYEDSFLGDLVITFETQRDFSKNEIELLRTIADQAGVALHQAELFEQTKKLAEREKLLRNITEKIRSSLNIEETLSFICEETAKIFNVQRSAITMYTDPQSHEKFALKKEYKLYANTKGLSDIDEMNKIQAFWANMLINNNKILAFNNILESDTPDYFKNGYNEIGIKSLIGTAIKKENDIWGILVLSEYEKQRYWGDEDKILLETIADQVYIAINQAELYEKAKLAAERERISRNIIEILRSSIDKTIIKKLFVKNIGKFFDADRVFFSDYSYKENRYIPVDETSEYLSSKEEKSFVGFDWSAPEIREYIQPLLEKREFKIFDWEEYIKQNPNKSADFIALFVDANVQSSYNFPVLYQDKIMGYFCIEFTKRVCKLSDEDINRIRNICTQAGIAIYHAGLYLKAQEIMFSRGEFISEISEKIKQPTNTILDTSLLLSKNEFERTVQLEYINNIINSCDQLLELTKTISEN